MMLAVAENGCSAGVQQASRFMRNALMMMMSAQISVSYSYVRAVFFQLV